MESLLFHIAVLISSTICLYLYWSEGKYSMDKQDLIIHLVFIFLLMTIAMFTLSLGLFGLLGVLK